MGRSRRRTVPTAPPAVPIRRPPHGAVALGLAVAALVLYAGALSNGFVFDDEGYVVTNANVHEGFTWRAVKWAFTSVHQSNYHPLTWLSHTLDWSLWGADPWGHHLTGILLHAANTVVLFLLFKRMTGFVGRSACVAALFAVHPLHVESVAWVAERKDTLSTLFWLLAMHAYVRYVALRGLRSYALALVFMVLGVLSKQMVVTLPVVLLLLDFWPLGRFTPGAAPSQPREPLSRIFVEKIPFLVIAVAGSVVAVLAQSRGGSLIAFNVIPLGQRIANAAVSYARYLFMAIWPANLAVFYPFRPVPLWQAVASAVVLVVLSALALKVARRHPAVIVGWLWYLVTLLPVIGLVQIGEQALADRYTYIPLIGIAAALCWLLPEALESRPRLRSMWLPIAAVILLAFSALTVKQVKTWRDEVTLYEHALSVTTGNYLAHDNLGTVLVSRGRLREAVEHYREAVRIRPGYAVAYSNLGSALADLGMPQEAIDAHRQAVRLQGGDALHRVNLGSALAAAGRIDEAAAEMAEAVRLQPDSVTGHTRLARFLAAQGKNVEAREHLDLALRLDPSNADALLELGNLLASEGRPDDARALFQRVASADPSNAVARTNLGILLVDKGDLAQGIAELSRAVELAPSMTIARENLLRALVTDAERLAEAGRYGDAVGQIDRALAVSGNAPQLRAALEARRAVYREGRPVVPTSR